MSELPTGDEKVKAVRSMFDTIAPRYELVNRFISLGLDKRWRKFSMKLIALKPNSLVLDLATGTGDYCRLLQAEGHRPVGVDLSLGMLEAARTSAPLVQADALRLPVADGSIDGVTCGFALRNFVELEPFFDELARTLRTGGRIALLDASQPTMPVARIGHKIYFGKVVPLIGRVFSDADAYKYLPKSLAYLPKPDALVQMISNAGFTDVDRVALSFGSAQLITATRK